MLNLYHIKYKNCLLNSIIFFNNNWLEKVLISSYSNDNNFSYNDYI